jgi:hypothetical protein
VTLRKALIEIAADYARRFLAETIADDLDACAAFMSTVSEIQIGRSALS